MAPPLWDAERDLVDPSGTATGRPGADGTGAVDVLRAAFAGVRSQVVAQGALKPGAVMPAVSMLDPRAEPVLRARVQEVIGCLEDVVARYPHDAELQEFLAIPPVLHQWILRHEAPLAPRVDFCRPDLLGSTLESARVLEFNPSSPGGVLVAGVLNRTWRTSPIGDVLAGWNAAPAPFERPTWFADWLLDHGRAHGVPHEDTTRIAFIHGRWRSRFEIEVIKSQFAARARELVFVDADGPLTAAGFRLAYLKHIPSDPDEVGEWPDLCTLLTSGDLVAPNLPAERWIAENKLCLAVLSDPRFRRLFTPAQRQALDALIPWSRRLGDGVTPAQAVAGRADLVLKAPYGYRGEAIVLGHRTDAATWAHLVHDPARRGWLVQRRVTPAVVPTREGTLYRDLKVAALRGRVIGYASRIGPDPVLNGARGSAAAAVFAPRPAAPGPHTGPHTGLHVGPHTARTHDFAPGPSTAGP